MNPFALLMLGLALVLVNVQVTALGNYEVPPDMAGYAVAVFALNNLIARVSSGSPRYPALQLARTVCSLLLLFSLPDLVPPDCVGLGLRVETLAACTDGWRLPVKETVYERVERQLPLLRRQ